ATDKQMKLSTEARIAAFAAKDQTDPKRYGEVIGQTVEEHIADSLRTLNQASNDVLNGLQRSNASFQETTTAHSSTLSLMDELRREQRRDRRFLPWVGIGGLVLALVMTLTLPGLLATTKFTCDLMVGYTWTTTTTGTHICVRYND
ncbi:MAG: hypothetical protein AAFV54_14820, partial [Pseudomonadota bacterium]